jgi:hypothetical protein
MPTTRPRDEGATPEPSKWCGGLLGLRCPDGAQECDGVRCPGERVTPQGHEETVTVQRRKVWLRGQGWSPVAGRKKTPGRMT